METGTNWQNILKEVSFSSKLNRHQKYRHIRPMSACQLHVALGMHATMSTK
jgi:hypothetical protein